jgi:hypothetical protein
VFVVANASQAKHKVGQNIAPICPGVHFYNDWRQQQQQHHIVSFKRPSKLPLLLLSRQ